MANTHLERGPERLSITLSARTQEILRSQQPDEKRGHQAVAKAYLAAARAAMRRGARAVTIATEHLDVAQLVAINLDAGEWKCCRVFAGKAEIPAEEALEVRQRAERRYLVEHSRPELPSIEELVNQHHWKRLSSRGSAPAVTMDDPAQPQEAVPEPEIPAAAPSEPEPEIPAEDDQFGDEFYP